MKMTKKARYAILDNVKRFNMDYNEMQAIKDTIYIIYNYDKDENARMTFDDLGMLQEDKEGSK